MDDSLDLARWQRPVYPHGIRVVQFEHQLIAEPTSYGWRIHNHPVNVVRNSIVFIVAALLLAGVASWTIAMAVPSFSSRTLWWWAGIACAWTCLCGVGGLVVQARLAKGRPPLLAVDAGTCTIVESINPAVVHARLCSLVLRVGKKTDPENRAGLPIVQVAVVFENENRLSVEPLWTFERPFFRAITLPLEDRLRIIAAPHGVDVVTVNGEPALVENAIV